MTNNRTNLAIGHLGLQTSEMLYGKSTFPSSRWWRS